MNLTGFSLMKSKKDFTMQPDNEILVKNWFLKADEAIEDAQKALDCNSLSM